MKNSTLQMEKFFFSSLINKFLDFKLRIKIYIINITRKFKRLIYKKLL